MNNIVSFYQIHIGKNNRLNGFHIRTYISYIN